MAESIEFNTTYFAEDIVRDAVNGCCHDFAFAIHRRTGWPVGILWKEPIIDAFTIFKEPQPIHLFCVAPDGQTIDAEGLHSFQALCERYTPAYKDSTLRVEIFPTERDWAERAESDELPLKPREHGIAAAEKVIAASPAFRALLRGLRPSPPPSLQIG